VPSGSLRKPNIQSTLRTHRKNAFVKCSNSYLKPKIASKQLAKERQLQFFNDVPDISFFVGEQ